MTLAVLSLALTTGLPHLALAGAVLVLARHINLITKGN